MSVQGIEHTVYIQIAKGYNGQNTTNKTLKYVREVTWYMLTTLKCQWISYFLGAIGKNSLRKCWESKVNLSWGQRNSS